jgi:hypothetical protein
MLDLDALTQSFLKLQWQTLTEEHDIDECAIHAIDTPGDERGMRLKAVADWLIYYKVHRIKSATAIQLASVVLQYADSHPSRSAPLSIDQIKEEFRHLRKSFLDSLGFENHYEDAPEIDSLTSKALWCCYPSQIPILDRFAEDSLRVLTRLCGISVTPNRSRFDSFIEAWFALYRKLKPGIESASLEGYSYKVRVLDQLLWWLGQDSFETHRVSDDAQL